MEFAVKRFARKILLLHLLLLVGVLGLVVLASRAIREGARDQAIKQAERRQRTLANQTARGIEAFYHSILNDMDLVPRDGGSDADRGRFGSALREFSREVSFPLLGGPPATQPGDGRRNGGGGNGIGGGPPGTQPSRTLPFGRPSNGIPYVEAPPAQGRPSGVTASGGGSGANRPAGGPANGQRPRLGRSLLVGELLGRQLEERVSHLFVVNRNVESAGPTKAAAAAVAASTHPSATHAPVATNSAKRPHDLVLGEVIKTRDGEGLKPDALVERYHDWLMGVREQSISRFELFPVPTKQDDGSTKDEMRGFNLVALPLGGPANNGRSAVLVAAVPVSAIAEQFLSALNEDEDTGAMLVNDALMVMAATRPELVGTSVAAAGDADFRASLDSFRTAGTPGNGLIEHAFTVGGETFEPAMLTAEPMRIDRSDKEGKRNWFVVVSSPLREVDAGVAQVFDKIFVWAAVVVVLMTGILLSTAWTLIRSRVKVERVRHETIRKELDRASQIQRAWLPAAPPDCRAVDVAAANFPANHISGDFYNWFDLPDGRIAVVIGDVTGHGMSAAFLMATTQLLVRTTMRRLTDPAECLAEVNRQLCTLVFNEQFVTLQIMVVDPDGGPVEVASAGHPAPLLADRDGFQPLPVDTGLVLGVDPDAEYETHAIALPAGASLLLYTDGAPDVLAPDGSRLGNAGLLATCPDRLSAAAATAAAAGAAGERGLASPSRRSPANQTESLDAQGMLAAVVGAVNHFRGSRELGDDLTFVAVRLARCAPAPEPELVGAA